MKEVNAERSCLDRKVATIFLKPDLTVMALLALVAETISENTCRPFATWENHAVMPAIERRSLRYIEWHRKRHINQLAAASSVDKSFLVLSE